MANDDTITSIGYSSSTQPKAIFSKELNAYIKLPTQPSEQENSQFKLKFSPTLIGEYLKTGNIAQPDALRVDNTNTKITAELDKKEFKIPTIPTNYPLNYDITKHLFNGKVEDLNRCLTGTKLEGKGQLFLNAQEKYGINAVFLMSIAKNESNFGAAPAKEKNGTVHRYNIAGLTTGSKVSGHRFQNSNSYADCIDSLCQNLQKHYISKHHTTISSIQSVYAPGNKAWANSVKNEMGELSTTIMKPYRTTPEQVNTKKSSHK